MQPPQKGATGIRRLVYATRYSLEGLAAAARHEAAFRQELLLAVILLPLGLWLGANGVERALLTGSVLLVLIVELLNSAVEAAIDRISAEHNELAKRAKVREVDFSDGHWHYEHIYGHGHHYHLRCVACGEMQEFEAPDLAHLEDWLAREYDYRIITHQLEVKGYCAGCREKTGSTGNR